MHVDVERISACALGELPEPERQVVLEHCKRCPYCGDQLAAAMLLAVAARQHSYGSRTGQPLAVPRWAAAAGLVVAAGLVTLAATAFLTRTDQGMLGERAARLVTDAEVATPIGDLTRDQELRQEIVEGARWIAEVTATPLNARSNAEVMPAVDQFERDDYLGAASTLMTVSSLPRYGEMILAASLFYGGELERAESIYERIIAEIVSPDAASGWDSNANTAAYFLARIYYDTARTDDARRWLRVATEARDPWAIRAEALVRERMASVFASRIGPTDGRRQARTDEDLQSLLIERARYLFPPDAVGRGWPWETGVPAALDAFEQGRFLAAAAELATVSRPERFDPGGFHEVLFGISLYYADQLEDAGRELTQVVGDSADLDERPTLWGFAEDAAAFYLARLYAHADDFDDARRLAGIVAAGDSAWVPAAELLLNAP